MFARMRVGSFDTCCARSAGPPSAALSQSSLLLLLFRRVRIAICVLRSVRSCLKFGACFNTGSILGSLVKTCGGGLHDLDQWRLVCAHFVPLVGSDIRPSRRLSASSSFSRYIFGEADFLGIWRVRWTSQSTHLFPSRRFRSGERVRIQAGCDPGERVRPLERTHSWRRPQPGRH